MRGPLSVLTVLALTLALAAPARAQGRRVEIHFTPTARAQLAIWIESEDGAIFQTLRLTDAVAYRGIGNRPGAMQMNSAWHWPYGRREGALPVWAHRRAEATGTLFPRVVFAGRPEGRASVWGDTVANTDDNYFCLAWANTGDDLDIVTCPSTFLSNKGRYLTDTDVAAGYAEPWVDPAGDPGMRPLGRSSLYPPRLDLGCTSTSCSRDHADVMRFASDARAVMPEIDAVTMPTPMGDVPFVEVFDVPASWPDGPYVLHVEANTEGDYAPGWDATARPTPTEPSGQWDSWAVTFGYPYRGQPSVVYDVPFELSSAGGEWSASAPAGYGELHGLDGRLRAMDGTIADDPRRTPGSGADRLRADEEGTRVRVVVPRTNVCEQPDAPEECGRECDASRPCAAPLICGPAHECVGVCDVPMQPGVPGAVVAQNHPERNRGHIWAKLRFVVPESARGIQRYEVRVGTSVITDAASFAAARPAKAASLDDLALRVPVEGEPGQEIEVELGGLLPETHYWVGVRAVDTCNSPGAVAVAEVTTTPIVFTTVSPCFVATAAYGSALDPRVGVLRRFRDRHLRNGALGRALVSLYETVGPPAARWIAESEARRAAARAALEPIVALLESL